VSEQAGRAEHDGHRRCVLGGVERLDIQPIALPTPEAGERERPGSPSDSTIRSTLRVETPAPSAESDHYSASTTSLGRTPRLRSRWTPLFSALTPG
jgi:hypothetical protein